MNMKRILLFTLILLFNCLDVVYTQNSPVPTKAEVFVGRQELDAEDLRLKTEQFLNRLANEPITTRGAIVIHYKYAWVNDCLTRQIKKNHAAESIVKEVVSVDTAITSERIVYVPGQISYRDEIQFWLVPDKAEVPEAPYRDFDPPTCCPQLPIVAKTGVKKKTGSIRFLLSLPNSKSFEKARYKWKISDGTIVSGQGSRLVEVDIRNVASSQVTATVEIEDAAMNGCPLFASQTTRIVP